MANDYRKQTIQRSAAIDAAIDFIQSHWPSFRTLARNAFRAHGRGAFLFNMEVDRNELIRPGSDFTYLTAKTAAGLSDGISAHILSGEVEAYDPARQVAFVFWWPELSVAMTRILFEWPNGVPRKIGERRWRDAARECPECDTEFKSFGDTAVCPKCRHVFTASEIEYSRGNHPAVPAIVD